MMNLIEKAMENLATLNDRSRWNKMVTDDALVMLETLAEAVNNGDFNLEEVFKPRVLREFLLNGARNWKEYSWGGCALIYDEDIARRYCTPSELKKTRNGQRKPNSTEEWLDVQARALLQAANRLFNALHVANQQIEAEALKEAA